MLANMGSISLRCIHSLYDQMPAPVQSAAREVIWRTLNSHEFIGEDNYLWALRILFESTVARQDANLMLHDLHILARVMEPIRRKEMGSWIRYTLRVEAPGYWFGDQHDRLNYYGSPQLSPFVRPEHLADVRGVQAHHPWAARSSAPLSARGWLARVTTIKVVIARVPPLNAAIMHRYGARLPPALRNTPFQSKSDRRRSTSRSARCP